MSNSILKGKKGIIFGALDDSSIAWKTAERVYEEGGEFILTNAPVSIRMGTINKLAEKTNSEIIPADATNLEDLEKLISHATEKFNGKLDFVLHSIGMSVNVRKGKHYTDLNYDWMTKGWDVSAVSFHKLMQSLLKLDAMKEWGSIVALTYIAAQRTFPNYNDMADNKAYLESIARSFGYFFGKEKNVRVNTISQSPTLTTAGKGVKGLDDFLKYADLTSPLGNATAEDCANLTVSLFSDYTKRVTLQNIYNDGGFSSVGVSQEIIDKLNSLSLSYSQPNHELEKIRTEKNGLAIQKKEIEKKMKESQENLKKIRVEGLSGANSVKVILDGEGIMQKIEISDETLKENKSVLEDLITAAHNNAKSKLREKTNEEISKTAGGFGIPGFKWPL